MTAQVTTNYSGRDVDLLIFQGMNPLGESKAALSLADEDGEGSICTGIQKAAQTFAILFLTDIGSNPWDASRGTSFMPSLRAGYIQDESSVQTQYEFAMLDIFDYLEGKILDTTPDDEILESATLLAFDIRPGFLSLQVKITTVAGDSRVYVIPVKTAL